MRIPLPVSMVRRFRVHQHEVQWADATPFIGSDLDLHQRHGFLLGPSPLPSSFDLRKCVRPFFSRRTPPSCRPLTPYQRSTSNTTSTSRRSVSLRPMLILCVTIPAAAIDRRSRFRSSRTCSPTAFPQRSARSSLERVRSHVPRHTRPPDCHTIHTLYAWHSRPVSALSRYSPLHYMRVPPP